MNRSARAEPLRRKLAKMQDHGTYHEARLWNRTASREIFIALFAYFLYFGVRGLTESRVEVARAHAEDIIRFERWLGLYHERSLQEAVADIPGAVTLMNWVYIWGHWPVIACVAIWLVWRHHEKYVLVRNTFLISGAIGLVIFTVFPMAPPRLMDIDLIDTVTERSNAYRVLQPPVFVNQYAAMPSLHLGWDLIIGIALFQNAGSWIFRVIGILLPLLMAAAIVLTGNHFIVDGVAGMALALFGLFCAYQLGAWHERRDTSAEPVTRKHATAHET